MQVLNISTTDGLSRVLDNLDAPAVIKLKNGTYRLKSEIRQDGVTLIGEERDKTVIEYGDYAKKIHADGKEYNTFRTYTLCVSGEDCRLENLTVRNTNTRPEEVGQCVALSVNCKRFYARNVNLVSTQDTLFLAPFPDDLVTRYRGFIPKNQLYMEGKSTHLFENCRIAGTVDFIFGCAEAYFKNCEIISLEERRGTAYIAAPAHPLAEERGFVFYDCDLKSEGAADGSVFLARPWRDYGKCAFINCRAGKHIKSELFDKWNDTDRDKSARFYFCGLDGLDPSPVGWAKKLSLAEANEIINYGNMKFKEIKSLI